LQKRRKADLRYRIVRAQWHEHADPTHAVDLLFEGSGGDALYELRDIQRAFRDVHAANSHNALNWDVAATLYGKVALGQRLDHPTI